MDRIDKNSCLVGRQVKLKLKNLPSSPGTYFFYDKHGRLIYIGKASVLKHRVGSYFIGAHDLKTEKLISQIANIKWQKTDSVIEALILESNLIKKHQPKYNIRERDDKSFVQIGLTNEEFPRFVVFRPTQLKNLSTRKSSLEVKKCFGPYTSVGAVNEILNILRKILPYRDCSPYKFFRFVKKMSPCLYYPLNLCPAPCTGYISKLEYAQIIKQISDFLDGKRKRVVFRLKKQMEKLSKLKKYEQAAKIRDRIYAFEHINDIAVIKQERSLEQTANIPKRIEAYDISNLPAGRQVSVKFAVGSMVVFEHGEVNKNDYRRFKIKNEYRKFRIKNYELVSKDSSRIRSNDKNHKSKILNLKSNISDPAMMAQIVDRRFNHLEWPKPDLIILDGGKAQLSAVGKVIKNKLLYKKMRSHKNVNYLLKMAEKKYLKKIKSIPIVAVAKGPTRKGFRLFKNNAAQKIVLDRKFIERMRDEAHRFAISYQRRLQQKSVSK